MIAFRFRQVLLYSILSYSHPQYTITNTGKQWHYIGGLTAFHVLQLMTINVNFTKKKMHT